MVFLHAGKRDPAAPAENAGNGFTAKGLAPKIANLVHVAGSQARCGSRLAVKLRYVSVCPLSDAVKKELPLNLSQSSSS